MRKVALALFLAAIPMMAASAPTVTIKNGFHTGQTYQTLSYAQRVGYMSGLVDGLLLAPFLGGSEENWLTRCMVGMSDTQMTAIADKYVSDHPQDWHQPMHVLAYNALLAGCTKK